MRLRNQILWHTLLIVLGAVLYLGWLSIVLTTNLALYHSIGLTVLYGFGCCVVMNAYWWSTACRPCLSEKMPEEAGGPMIIAFFLPGLLIAMSGRTCPMANYANQTIHLSTESLDVLNNRNGSEFICTLQNLEQLVNPQGPVFWTRTEIDEYQFIQPLFDPSSNQTLPIALLGYILNHFPNRPNDMKELAHFPNLLLQTSNDKDWQPTLSQTLSQWPGSPPLPIWTVCQLYYDGELAFSDCQDFRIAALVWLLVVLVVHIVVASCSCRSSVAWESKTVVEAQVSV